MSDTTVWVLRPRDDRPDDDDPWDPWYDKCFGMVIRAETEAEAREVAQDNAECEVGYGKDKPEVWTDPDISDCVPIEEYHPEREGKYSTDDSVLMRDVAHA